MIIANEEYWSASHYVPIIAFSYVFNGLNLIFNAPLYVNKKTHIIAFINISAAIINIILNYFLVRKYGIMGAAISTLLSFAYIYTCTYYYSIRVTKINWEWPRAFKPIILGLTIIIICNQINVDSQLLMIVIKFSFLITMLILLLLFGFFRKEEILFIKERASLMLNGKPK